MKGLETLFCLAYCIWIIEAANYTLIFLAFNFPITNDYSEVLFDTELFPTCISDLKVRPLVLGRVLEWYALEIVVFFGYLFTMVLLMIKSRFKLVGVDQSG